MKKLKRGVEEFYEDMSIETSSLPFPADSACKLSIT